MTRGRILFSTLFLATGVLLAARLGIARAAPGVASSVLSLVAAQATCQTPKPADLPCATYSCSGTTWVLVPRAAGTACPTAGTAGANPCELYCDGVAAFCQPVPGSCTPTTCQARGKNCGSISNGCGGTLACGSCATGYPCVNNVCSKCPSGTIDCNRDGSLCAKVCP